MLSAIKGLIELYQARRENPVYVYSNPLKRGMGPGAIYLFFWLSPLFFVLALLQSNEFRSAPFIFELYEEAPIVPLIWITASVCVAVLTLTPNWRSRERLTDQLLTGMKTSEILFGIFWWPILAALIPTFASVVVSLITQVYLVAALGKEFKPSGLLLGFFGHLYIFVTTAIIAITQWTERRRWTAALLVAVPGHLFGILMVLSLNLIPFSRSIEYSYLQSFLMLILAAASIYSLVRSCGPRLNASYFALVDPVKYYTESPFAREKLGFRKTTSGRQNFLSLLKWKVRLIPFEILVLIGTQLLFLTPLLIIESSTSSSNRSMLLAGAVMTTITALGAAVAINQWLLRRSNHEGQSSLLSGFLGGSLVIHLVIPIIVMWLVTFLMVLASQSRPIMKPWEILMMLLFCGMIVIPHALVSGFVLVSILGAKRTNRAIVLNLIAIAVIQLGVYADYSLRYSTLMLGTQLLIFYIAGTFVLFGSVFQRLFEKEILHTPLGRLNVAQSMDSSEPIIPESLAKVT